MTEQYIKQNILDELYKQSSKGRYFKKLYDLIISEENITLAYKNVKNNIGMKTKDVNGHNLRYLKNLSIENVIKIVRKKLEVFKPSPVRKVYIPISNGKQKILGIPTIEDRLVQQSILQILDPICEARFHKASFGNRIARNTHNAVARYQHLVNHTKNHFVVNIEIEQFCRKRISNKLKKVSSLELEKLKRGRFGNRSLEYIENRVAIFSKQNGKCYLTGIRLDVEDVHCHHKIPIKFGGSDEMDNLIIIHKDVHKIIHSANHEKILELTSNWTIKSKMKLNKLRKTANLKTIEF